MQGEGTIPDRAGVLQVGGQVEPALVHGPWILEAPLELRHRQTFGASLSEVRGQGGAAFGFRPGPRLRVEADLDVLAYWRPEWPDQYQPTPSGGLESTDRYSHWDRRAGASVAGIPLRHEHARVAYRYTLVDTREDPAFQPVEGPTHLTPGDREEHDVGASWRHLGDGWKIGARADAFWKNYFFVFARDAGTGKTHAGAGGPAPNPLQRIRGVEPGADAELEAAGGRVEIDVGYGYEIVDDEFQGYYSYRGHHPTAKVTWQPTPATRFRLGGELHWKRYGPGSYAEGPDHPPLTSGDRRVDRVWTTRLDGRVALGPHWAVTAEIDMTVRRTNFPPYRPGVFPAGRSYDIDWSYENWLALAGVEFRY